MLKGGVVRSISSKMNRVHTLQNCNRSMCLLAAEQHPLLSEDNRLRCLHEMQRAPPIGIKLRKVEQEQAYASVLIALCTERSNNDVNILYTRRSSKLSRHKRQISFPGGIRDDTDADYIECALRETEEEIGLPRERIEIWGQGTLVRPPHTAAIMPVIGIVHDFDTSELKLNYDEVEAAFTIPIQRMITPTAARYTQFKSGYSSPAFVVDQYRVWGVTGYITNMFLRCLIPKTEQNGLKNNIKYIRPFKHKRT